MGMDVYGIAPTSEKGEYFRNNVWYWRPLWDYVTEIAPDLTEGVNGHYNDGDGIRDAEGARTLGQTLLISLSNGTAREYIAERNKAMSELPMEECRLCDSTGIRSDEVGVEHGMVDKILDEDKASIFGRTIGWCNGCDGAGQKLPFETHYPLDEDNIREFATFLIDSGGFEIC